MSSPKVLITAEVHPYLPARFRELGWEVDIIEEIGRNKLLEIIPGYAALIITTYLKADRELLDQAAQLKVIGRLGSGMENVDVASAREKNITCVNSPEGNANAVGEHTLGLLLNLLHKINSSAEELKQGTWNREANRGMALGGKTVGIIGFGHTGSAFARKLSGLEVRILAFDPYKKIDTHSIEQTELAYLQQNSDVISFHVPYTNETHHYISDTFIQNCSRRPILLNTSRGAITDTKAVIAAIENKRISGYGTDVYEDEPITKGSINEFALYQQLFACKNVIATPHIAGWTVESKYLLAKVLMDKLESLLTF